MKNNIINIVIAIVIFCLSVSLLLALGKLGDINFKNKQMLYELEYQMSQNDSLRRLTDSTYITP